MFYQMLFNLPTCWWERTYYHHPYSNFIPVRKDLSRIPTEQLGNLSRALVVREEPRICTILTVRNVFSTIPGFCHWSPFGRQPCDSFLALWPHLYSCLPSLVAKNTSAKEFIGHRTEFLCAEPKWATPETWECPALRKHPSLMGPAQVWQAYIHTSCYSENTFPLVSPELWQGSNCNSKISRETFSRPNEANDSFAGFSCSQMNLNALRVYQKSKHSLSSDKGIEPFLFLLSG